MDILDSEFGISARFGENAKESMLCESAPKRKIKDIMMKGKHMYMLNKNGHSRRKEYGIRDTWGSLLVEY